MAARNETRLFWRSDSLAVTHPRKQPNCLGSVVRCCRCHAVGELTLRSSQSYVRGALPVESDFSYRVGSSGSPGAMPSSRSRVQTPGSGSASRHSRAQFARYLTRRHARLGEAGTMTNDGSFITGEETNWNSSHVCVPLMMMTETWSAATVC